MSAGALPGFRDFYPTELAERNYLFGVWRDVARRFGFVEYDGPPLEPLELYTKKSGDEIVGQLYSFEDKGGRAVALRPEMTPTLARMVAARANALRKPVRWFSIPQLFRYERQQKGRLREHFQLNVDIVGETDVVADAELLAVAIEIMRALKLSSQEVVARVSDRRLLSAILEAWGISGAFLSVAFSAIDKLGREPRDVLIERMARGGIGKQVAHELLELIGHKHGTVKQLRNNLGSNYESDERVGESLERLERYESLLQAHDVFDYYELDLRVVRGLAYYTGIVFELFDRAGEFRAICGGGRYDSLLSDLADVDLPALGFGMGDVVINELRRERALLPTADLAQRLDYWVGTDDRYLLQKATVVARRLRREWQQSVECATKVMSVSKQMSLANRIGVRKLLNVDDPNGCALYSMDVSLRIPAVTIDLFLAGEASHMTKPLKPDSELASLASLGPAS